MNDIDKNFLDIKNTTLELENSIKEQELKLTTTINNDEDKLKDLSDKKILFDKNKIQADILKNQQFLIDEYKRNINRLNLELTENLASIGVYPNPSSNGVFYIQNDLNTELISIKNSIGQSISFNIKESNGGLLLKLMTTSKGIYFLSYFTKDGIQKTTTLLVN